MQRAALEREVERVTDLARRLQPGCERELPGLARKSTGQQSMLNLCCQRQENRTLSPLEEIGVAAIRNHDVREEVRRQSHVGHRLGDRVLLEPQLQYADRFAATRHRREHASALVLDDHLDRLGGQRPPMRRPRRRYPLRSLLPRRAEYAFRAGVTQSDQRRPLKSAIRKLTSRAPIASASAAASTSIAATGGAASTAASR